MFQGTYFYGHFEMPPKVVILLSPQASINRYIDQLARKMTS